MARVLSDPAGVAIATERETTQPSFVDLVRWSATVARFTSEGALDRALRLDLEPRLSARLAELSLIEHEAAEDAVALDTAAAEARADAEAAADEAAVHERAAAAARAEARERLEDARALERQLAGEPFDERPYPSQAADSGGGRRHVRGNRNPPSGARTFASRRSVTTSGRIEICSPCPFSQYSRDFRPEDNR